MTDPKNDPKMSAETLWSRLSWQQVTALGLVIAGAVLTLVMVPADTLASIPWEAIVGSVVSAIGVLYGIASPPIVRPRASSPPPAPAPSTLAPSPVRRPTPRREGSVTIEVLSIIITWAVATVVASTLTGCGASALGVHVRAATIATSALEGVGPLVEAAVSHRIETECGPASAGDVACVQALRLELAPTIAAVDVPVISARAALGTYVGTLRLLLEADAGEDVDVLSAVGALAGRLAAAWPDLVAALRPLGVELPIPPYLELAAAVLGGAR